ncbi:VOC family protein [Caldanaerobacter subterraneus]|uniref:Lactoylglutathione lyase n=2 Tax=Caldanaerobacter subterraneus TaxID=911092 RepID=U5CP82_CALSX|nr:VOC family protein [Caldanaerobacter subterraneus]ERM91589.1 lactoylglutathione lyase [Caldanaerobacter subterraneus subsp. yonseiensis KB-1]NNG67004.1 VOC family protein [Caldanaerobacter subterraneus]
MSKNILDMRNTVQIGIVVRDIEESLQNYAEFFGVEKPQWFWTDDYSKAHTKFNGRPTKARAKLAFFELGPLQLELIEPDENPSTWREFLDKNGEGIHHIAFVVKDMDRKIEELYRKGMKVIQKGDFEGGRYAYIDTLRALKVMIELLENY